MSPDQEVPSNPLFDIEGADLAINKKWASYELKVGFAHEMHVVPDEDVAIHSWEQTCNCHPFVQKTNLGGIIITHNSWDGREFLQGGAAVAPRAKME